MSDCATAACCSRAPIRARPRRWCSTPTTAPLLFFKGTCTRGIYDNMKTAVETVFIGKDRQFNRRFLRMCGHYLVEPTACTPASGWEKGQVENQVGVVRERFFTPRLRVASYEELNAWLLDRCVAYAKAHKHPELADRTIWQAFEAERPQLVQITGPSTGSTRRKHRSRRLASCGSATTSIRSPRALWAGRSRSRPTPVLGPAEGRTRGPIAL